MINPAPAPCRSSALQLLACSCLAALLLHASTRDTSATAIMQDEVEQKYAFSESGTVTIRNGDGRIHVYGSDGPELKIYASRRAFSQERLEALQVKTTIEGDTAVIETITAPPPDGQRDRSGTIDYRIYLPQGSTLASVELANGEILLDGMRGPSATARVGNGRLVARNCFTALDVRVERGGMDLFYMWWEDEDFSLVAELNHGSVRLGLPPDALAVVEAATKNGHIRSQFDKEKPKNADARTRQLAIGEEETDIRLKLRTTNGNIRIDRSY